MIRPTFFIGRFIVRTLINHLRLNTVFFKLFKVLFAATSTSILTVGIIPTLRFLFRIPRLINNGSSITGVRILSSVSGFNTQVTGIIINSILPNWNDCMKEPKIFHKLYWIFLIFVVLGGFRPIIFHILKLLFTFIFASIGINFSDTLSGIKILKLLPDNFLEFVQSYLQIILFLNLKKYLNSSNINPSIFNESLPELDNSTANDYSTSILSIMGFILLGVTGIVVALIITDLYIPTQQIPLLHYLTDIFILLL